MQKTPYNDLFPNIDLIKSAKCKTLIIHGAEDEEVPVEHAKLLKENAGNCSDFWLAPGCGHNDIDLKQNLEFYKKLTWFFRDLEKSQRGKNEEELYLANKAEIWPVKFNHLYRKIEKDLEKTGFDVRKKSILIAGIFI